MPGLELVNGGADLVVLAAQAFYACAAAGQRGSQFAAHHFLFGREAVGGAAQLLNGRFGRAECCAQTAGYGGADF